MKRPDMDRRAFLASLASAGALAGCGGHLTGPLPGVGQPFGVLGEHAISNTVLTITNNTSFPDAQVWYYVWGRDAATNTYQYLLPDGKTAKWTTAVGNDFGIRLSGKNDLKLPVLTAAEIYVSLGPKPNFLNGSPNQIEPVAPNGWNPNAFGGNYDKLFDHIEYTYAGETLGVNTTTVDMLSLPLTYNVSVGGTTQQFGFDPKKRLSNLYAEFAKLKDFKNLLVPGSKNGTYLRAIAPGHGIENAMAKQPNGFPVDYLKSYIDDCWAYYADTGTNELAVWTDDGTKLLATGQVNSSGVFQFRNPNRTLLTYTDPTGKFWDGFPKPSSLGAFECSATELPSPSDGSQPVNSILNSFGACGKNLGASINRTVLKLAKRQPFCQPGKYYQAATTNMYSKILHEYGINGDMYGFAYDDVCGYSNYSAFNKVTKLELIVGPVE